MSHMFGYIGPGGGVTIGALVVILIGGIVVSAVGFILWLRVKRFLRGEGKGKWGVKVALQALVLLSVLSVFGWMSKHRAKKDKDFGVANGFVEALSGFPDLFKQSVEEVKTLPQTFVPTPEDFEPINLLQDDLLTLTVYSNGSEGRTLAVRNLRNNEELHQWVLPDSIGPLKPHFRIHHPLLLEGKSVVSFITNRAPLFRLDSAANLMWRQDSLSFHHAINRAANGDLWVCAMKWERGGRHIGYRGRYVMGDKTVNFLDNSVARIDAETGYILEVHSMAEMLKDSGLDHLVLRSGDAQDPLHLNDVQPALTTTDHLQRRRPLSQLSETCNVCFSFGLPLGMWFGSSTAPSPPSMTWTLSTTARWPFSTTTPKKTRGFTPTKRTSTLCPRTSWNWRTTTAKSPCLTWPQGRSRRC